jgi:hypothetical protein
MRLTKIMSTYESPESLNASGFYDLTEEEQNQWRDARVALYKERQKPDQYGYTWFQRRSLETMTPGEISNDFRVKNNDYSTHVKKAKFVGRTSNGLEFIYDVTLKDETKTQVFYSMTFGTPVGDVFKCRRA